ncbi:hypothetical protein IV203_001747 [Nitzschia inconspicua]|uniref:Uncharacterized protein n=1 Tax=Nitzschia inconspicua TaxID=303405 RepID=A0A9K3PTX3_9STRA|nr:hypothetical protein IV203_001747 [Nitzschia inconspicua]
MEVNAFPMPPLPSPADIKDIVFQNKHSKSNVLIATQKEPFRDLTWAYYRKGMATKIHISDYWDDSFAGDVPPPVKTVRVGSKANKTLKTASTTDNSSRRSPAKRRNKKRTSKSKGRKIKVAKRKQRHTRRDRDHSSSSDSSSSESSSSSSSSTPVRKKRKNERKVSVKNGSKQRAVTQAASNRRKSKRLGLANFDNSWRGPGRSSSSSSSDEDVSKRKNKRGKDKHRRGATKEKKQETSMVKAIDMVGNVESYNGNSRKSNKRRGEKQATKTKEKGENSMSLTELWNASSQQNHNSNSSHYDDVEENSHQMDVADTSNIEDDVSEVINVENEKANNTNKMEAWSGEIYKEPFQGNSYSREGPRRGKRTDKEFQPPPARKKQSRGCFGWLFGRKNLKEEEAKGTTSRNSNRTVSLDHKNITGPSTRLSHASNTTLEVILESSENDDTQRG